MLNRSNVPLLAIFIVASTATVVPDLATNEIRFEHDARNDEPKERSEIALSTESFNITAILDHDRIFAQIEGLRNALGKLIHLAVGHLIDSFLPTLSRARRSADEEEKLYMDGLITGMGAVLDKQECRSRVTCNAGKVIQHKIPGAQVGIMVMESVIPDYWRDWFSTVKRSVTDRSQDCIRHFKCELLPDE